LASARSHGELSFTYRSIWWGLAAVKVRKSRETTAGDFTPNDMDGTSLSSEQQRCSIHAVAGRALGRAWADGLGWWDM
jgi:hypothetical protein